MLRTEGLTLFDPSPQGLLIDLAVIVGARNPSEVLQQTVGGRAQRRTFFGILDSPFGWVITTIVAPVDERKGLREQRWRLAELLFKVRDTVRLMFKHLNE